jgi:hypothetical protein
VVGGFKEKKEEEKLEEILWTCAMVDVCGMILIKESTTLS